MARADILEKKKENTVDRRPGEDQRKVVVEGEGGVDLIERAHPVIISRLVHCRFLGTAHAHYCFPNSAPEQPVVDHVHFPIPRLPPPHPFIVFHCWIFDACATFRRDPEG